MGKLDAGGDGQDLQGADLPTAVPTVGVPVGFRCLSPEQTGQLLVQDGLVAFDGQDPVRAAAARTWRAAAVRVREPRNVLPSTAIVRLEPYAAGGYARGQPCPDRGGEQVGDPLGRAESGRVTSVR